MTPPEKTEALRMIFILIGLASAAFVVWLVASMVERRAIEKLVLLHGSRVAAFRSLEIMEDLGLTNIYPTLRRMEFRGWLESRSTQGGPERGGRPVRWYNVTALGVRVLAERTSVWR